MFVQGGGIGVFFFPFPARAAHTVRYFGQPGEGGGGGGRLQHPLQLKCFLLWKPKVWGRRGGCFQKIRLWERFRSFPEVVGLETKTPGDAKRPPSFPPLPPPGPGSSAALLQKG